jgi:glutaconate CoA-transferase subunit B
MSEETKDYTLGELCITACAEAWRGDNEMLASGMGLIPRLGAGLAKLTFSPGLLLNDAECRLVSEPIPVGPRGDYKLKIEGWLPFARVFDFLWRGTRHAMTMPTQIDRYGCSNISVIGDHSQPKVQLLGVRGIPGNTINHPCSYFIPAHGPRIFVDQVDMASGVGYDSARWRDGARRDLMELRRVISNLAVMDFGGPGNTMRIISTHPGVTVEQVQEQTGFELAVADKVKETAIPTSEQLAMISDVLDPHNLRASAVKES